MSSLRRCTKCGSFVASDRCPSCGGALLRATKLGVLATALGSGAFAMTLMACYGCPDCKFEDYDGSTGDTDADARRVDARVVNPGDDDDAGETKPRDSGADAPSDAGADADADAG